VQNIKTNHTISIQFQAIAVGLLASVSPYWMGSPPESIRLALLLSASSVVSKDRTPSALSYFHFDSF